jgi:hypothetical protein
MSKRKKKLRIKFSESFEEIAHKNMGISKEEVIQTIEKPLRKQLILFDGLELVFFLKEEKDSYLLVMAQQRGATLLIRSSCFRILPELLEHVGTDEPIVLLQQLAINFGLPIRVGEHEGRFFFRERIPVPEVKIKFLFRIIGLEKIRGNVISSTFLRPQKGFAEIAILFSIHLDAYLSWLKGTQTLQVSSKTYDVFIAYKRNTAKDFAVHLKSTLTDNGYRAFLDLTDIPEQFSGITAWYDVRNSAILNTRSFLLIITAGIEKSLEVAKELFLARKVKGMKFIYLSHEDLDPKVIIEHDGELIDLSEGNQVKFDTKEDLARKTLKILSQN